VAFPRALNGGRPKMAKFAPLNMSPEEIIEYTPEWNGERFADGRPRVPDDLLERMVRFHPAAARTALTRCTACLPASHQSHPATAVARWSAVTGPVCMLRSAAYRSRRRGAQSVATATKTSTKVASSRLILDSRWWAGP
jgi:hypothetical protein